MPINHRDKMNGKSYVVVDIETADLDISDSAINNYLDEKEIVPALHPYFSRIISIGLKPADGEPQVYHGEDEAELLASFWKYVKYRPTSLFVTFNGYRFDIPYINVRSILNGIRPELGINLNKWNMNRSNHFDIMQGLSQFGVFSWVSLEITARTLGVPVPDDIIPSEKMPDLYRAGDWESIVRHNTHDILMTEAIYLKIRDTF